MGRHRKQTTATGDVIKQKHVGDGPDKTEPAPPVVEARMGLDIGVCVECNARNRNRETCRKCGGLVRRKNEQYGNV